MRKFNIRKVLDGLTAGSSSAAQPPPPAPPGSREPEVAETLQAEHFQLCKTVRHGFPYRPSALAFDPVQKILAVGTQLGALRLNTDVNSQPRRKPAKPSKTTTQEKTERAVVADGCIQGQIGVLHRNLIQSHPWILQALNGGTNFYILG
ncbi:syntaxin-binding protein 5-like isoform X2 [Choloepus didactylus]|uniref:syntaxin-binding protein 5-like isoform X2 n=1 Tax=Choloepus didactylus TaxID=27675 RepID=UPI0018A1181A|nr:syntaxin-binding protein 5-like isoform X2 [Choloepus didactylus]XP_037669648.1 syntaxin-binding protein 5-like isoform X2 [Choloepus didactylus]